MPCGTYKIDKVPAATVDQTVQMFQANVPPPTSVTKTQNPDGTYLVTAEWPPCPPNTTHDPGS